MKILIVEDGMTTADAFAASPAAAGHEVRVYRLGWTAQCEVTHHGYRPDAVIADVELPDGSGVDLLRTLAGLLPAAHLVGITALSGAEFLKASAALGDIGAPLFQKTVEMADILRAVGVEAKP